MLARGDAGAECDQGGPLGSLQRARNGDAEEVGGLGCAMGMPISSSDPNPDPLCTGHLGRGPAVLARGDARAQRDRVPEGH